MKLNVHFFNVNHGDSIVIELEASTPKYIVIDSNIVIQDGQKICPAYKYLKDKKVKKINAIVITHLHKDHFTGVENFLREFQIGKLFIPPFLSKKSKIFNRQLDKIKEKIKEIRQLTADEIINSNIKSLAYLVNYITNNEDKVEEAIGKEQVFRVPELNEFTGMIFLPLVKIKGVLHKLFENGQFFDPASFPTMNDASVAVKINFADRNILFTGDSTLSMWLEHQRQMHRDGVDNLDIDFLKVSHHGSRENNTEKLYEYIFKDFSPIKHLFVSANGISHPHDEFWLLVNKYNLKPHCTNLSRQCMGGNVEKFVPQDKLPKEFRTFIEKYEIISQPIPCQGNITLTINSDSCDINGSSNVPCLYGSEIYDY